MPRSIAQGSHTFFVEARSPPIPFARVEEGKFLVLQGETFVSASSPQAAISSVLRHFEEQGIEAYEIRAYRTVRKYSVDKDDWVQEKGGGARRYLSPLAATLTYDGVVRIEPDRTLYDKLDRRVRIRTRSFVAAFRNDSELTQA